MRQFTPSKSMHFTPFRSAAEEVAQLSKSRTVGQSNHMFARSGYIVQTRGAHMPYKVVFDHEHGPDSELACMTMQDCQKLIRQNTPTPGLEDPSRDQEAIAV